MPNSFTGTGNLAEAPSLKHVTIGGEDRAVANLRVFFDEYRRNDDGEFEQNGGLWLSVSVWGRLAEEAARLLRKGVRVRVDGRLKLGNWIDKDTGESTPTIEVEADDITAKLTRIESIQFRASRRNADEPAGDAPLAPSGADPGEAEPARKAGKARKPVAADSAAAPL